MDPPSSRFTGDFARTMVTEVCGAVVVAVVVVVDVGLVVVVVAGGAAVVVGTGTVVVVTGGARVLEVVVEVVEVVCAPICTVAGTSAVAPSMPKREINAAAVAAPVSETAQTPQRGRALWRVDPRLLRGRPASLCS